MGLLAWSASAQNWTVGGRIGSGFQAVGQYVFSNDNYVEARFGAYWANAGGTVTADFSVLYNWNVCNMDWTPSAGRWFFDAGAGINVGGKGHYAYVGVGLAAPQIGKSIRLFIVDCTPWGEDHPELADYRRAFINPEIYEVSEETKLYEEGCLSLPGLHESVRRSLAIRMRYLDENFEPHDEEFTGLPAWVIQHEYDHLEGVVFTDRLSPLRRNLIKSKLMSLTKGRYKCSYKTK